MNTADKPQTQVEGFLCRAWGESDLPEARIVRSQAEWEAFVVEAQWGPNVTLDAEDREAVDAQVRYIVEDMADNGIGCIEFEIGGISVERVTFLSAELVASHPAEMMDTEVQKSKTAHPVVGLPCKDLQTALADEYEYVTCEDCDGKRIVDEYPGDGRFQPPEPIYCESCGGSGKWRVLRSGAASEAVSGSARSDEKAPAVGVGSPVSTAMEVLPIDAFEKGWRTAAAWAHREDLYADIGGPAYLRDRRNALNPYPCHRCGSTDEKAMASCKREDCAWRCDPLVSAQGATR